MIDRRIQQSLGVLILSISLAACAQTSYQTYERVSSGTPTLEGGISSRKVTYEINKSFYRNPPTCIVVLNAIGSVRARHRHLVERVAARHLRGKIAHVIGPDERRALERRLGYDLANSRDLRDFSESKHNQVRCDHFVQIKVKGLEESYAFIWSHRRIHISMNITSIKSSESVWRAEHVASRGDGGLPLSPFSLGTAAFRAGQLYGDKDVFPSLIDDVYRRMLVTLPDVRSY